MSRSSILGAQRADRQAEGRDVDALGPSDTSDSGSDIAGATVIDAADELDNIGQDLHSGRAGDSDAGGTGERGSAVLGEDVEDGADILPDRVGSFGEELDTLDDGQGVLDLVDELADDDGPDGRPEDSVEPEDAGPSGSSRRN